jgi:potassium-dependent mechanosensitive channel
MRGLFTPFLRCFGQLLAAGALASLLTLAAASPEPPSPTSSGTAAANPVAAPDILTRADEDLQRVDRAKRLLQAADPSEQLARELDDIARPVDAKLNAAAGGTLRTLTVMRLESLARHWDFDERRFARWEDRSRRALSPYADTALQLAQRRAAWSATRAAGLLDGLPATLSARVDTMLSQFDASEEALGAVLAKQFDLTQRASDLKARLQAGSTEVDAAIDEIDRQLLRTDVPPLWSEFWPAAGTAGAMAAMERGFEIERQFAVDYNAADGGNQQTLRIIQILLLPLILWLTVRSRRPPDDGKTSHVTRALRRPVSSWLLLAMLGVLVLEPDAPLLVQELALVLALIPVLRLLPSGAIRALGRWPYVAVALYVVDRLGVAAPADVGLYRLYTLAVSLLAMGLTVWLLRRTPQHRPPRASRLQTGVRRISWIVLAVLTLSVAANIGGNISLAETLTSGVIDSGYMALLLYAGVAAVQGILHALGRQPELAQRKLVRQHGAALAVMVTRLLVLAAWLGWLVYSMDRFRVLRPLRAVGATVLDLGVDVGEVSIHLGDVLVFLVSTWLALWVARAVRRLLRDELPHHAALPRGVGNSIASLSYYGVLLLGLLVALSAAGFKVSQLALVFGALGVGIGFGLQGVVNNFVSGLVLMFERPIQPGDMVDAAGTSGTVREIGLRATILRTFDGADVVVPNGLLLSGNLTNWTMFDRSRRIEIPVDVAYGSDPARVLSVLGSAARETPGVATHPPPVVLMTGYADSALTFSVRVWTQEVGGWTTLRGELLARVLAALQGAGIDIPYPQMDVHLRSMPAGVEVAARTTARGDMDRPEDEPRA